MTGFIPNSPSFSPNEPGRGNPEFAAPPWRNEVTARVRAHRSRTTRVPANQPSLPGMEDFHAPALVAARVAERYARLPSYREMLEAQAAAAKSAVDERIAAASQPRDVDPVQPTDAAAPAQSEPFVEPDPHQPALLRYSVASDSLPPPRLTPAQARADAAPPISHAPDFIDPLEAALVEPAWPLPASLITHPRELIAPRKARPRLAEGPLREDFDAVAAGSENPQSSAFAEAEHPVSHSPAGDAQLRIPEVGPDASLEPAPAWRSIHLDAENPMRQSKQSSSLPDGPRLQVASLEDRALAALVDCAFTLAAFLLFALVFAVCSTSLPSGRAALIVAAVTLFAMWLMYQLLFFTLTDATPGMRYAKIALCTFGDETPSRSTRRGRIAALLLSALPLGLGFLWAVFDEDALGWHDRITQTYQRSYKEQ
ncbi:MAG: RDD family protein [Acidobacteriaceae bacterium]